MPEGRRFYVTAFCAAPGDDQATGATKNMHVDCPADATLLQAIHVFAHSPALLADLPKGAELKAVTFTTIPMPG